MNDDKLLRALGALAREQAAEEPPAHLVPPPTAEQKARAVERSLATLQGRPAQVEQPRQERAAAQVSRPRWRWPLVFGTPLLAAAAMLLLWVRGGGPHATLPEYALMIEGGVSEIRGAGPKKEGEALQLEPGVRVQITVRPLETVAQAVDGRFFWVKDGRAQRWAVTPERAPGGALRVIAPAERPFGAGAGELVVVVGPPDRLPEQVDDASLFAQADAAAKQGWRVKRWPVLWR